MWRFLQRQQPRNFLRILTMIRYSLSLQNGTKLFPGFIASLHCFVHSIQVFSFWFTHIVLSYRSNKVQDLMMRQTMLNVHLLHHQYVFTRIPKSVAQILDNIYHLIHVLLFFYHDITTLDLCLSWSIQSIFKFNSMPIPSERTHLSFSPRV